MIEHYRTIARLQRELADAYELANYDGAYTPTIDWCRANADEFDAAANELEREHQRELEF